MLLNALILFTVLCWSIWGIFDKKALETANNKDVLLMLHVLYALEIPIVCAALFYFRCGFNIPPTVFLWEALASFCSTGAIAAYLVAMSNAEASYVLGITASYPVVTQFLAQMLLQEPVIGQRVMGSLLIGSGVAAIGSSPSTKKQIRHWKRKLLVAVCVTLATLGWGVYGLFDKKALELANSLQVYLARVCCDGVGLLLIVLYFKQTGYKAQLSNKKSWVFCMSSGLCLSLGSVAYMFAMSMATASYVIVITGCYPLLMYFFALAFLKEKPNALRLAGVTLVVVGGLLVQRTQS